MSTMCCARLSFHTSSIAVREADIPYILLFNI